MNSVLPFEPLGAGIFIYNASVCKGSFVKVSDNQSSVPRTPVNTSEPNILSLSIPCVQDTVGVDVDELDELDESFGLDGLDELFELDELFVLDELDEIDELDELCDEDMDEDRLYLRF